MQLIVLAEEQGKKEFLAKKTAAGNEIIFIQEFSEISDHNSADAFFILINKLQQPDFKIVKDKPVFINSTINTLKELNLPDNYIRMNGWVGFVNRDIWEIATTKEELVTSVFEKLEWKYIRVADEPGLVSGRIISMIVNEAYFALGEEVSTKDEIDLAMKLGTNYPYGPFEWSKLIGLKNVHDLLEMLSGTDRRYSVAPALKKEIHF